MAAGGTKGMVAEDDLMLPPLVMGVLTLDRETRHFSGPGGHFDLRWAVLLVLERLMQRPGAFLGEDRLLTVLFGEDVPENGAAVLNEAMKDATAATRLLSRNQVRIRRDLPAGYVMEMRLPARRRRPRPG